MKLRPLPPERRCQPLCEPGHDVEERAKLWQLVSAKQTGDSSRGGASLGLQCFKILVVFTDKGRDRRTLAMGGISDGEEASEDCTR